MFDVSGDDLFDFSYSPDGQQFAATRGGWQFDLVLLNGFKPYDSKTNDCGVIAVNGFRKFQGPVSGA
jgi:hypothetical protein